MIAVYKLDECSNVLCVVDRVNLLYCRNTISLEKGIEELRELEIAIHSTTQMSSQQCRYLDEIKTDKFNSKDKLRDPTLIRA